MLSKQSFWNHLFFIWQNLVKYIIIYMLGIPYRNCSAHLELFYYLNHVVMIITWIMYDYFPKYSLLRLIISLYLSAKPPLMAHVWIYVSPEYNNVSCKRHIQKTSKRHIQLRICLLQICFCTLWWKCLMAVIAVIVTSEQKASMAVHFIGVLILAINN